MYAFWEITASNAVVATILAIGVMLLSRIWKNAAAVHALWVVVLLKLFTPPLITAGLPFAFRPVTAVESSHPRKTTLRSPVRDEVPSAAPVGRGASFSRHHSGQPAALARESAHRDGRHRAVVVSAVLATIWIGGACCTVLDTLEFLSEQPRHRVPLRTAIDPACSLSRRISMLTQKRPNRLSLLSARRSSSLSPPSRWPSPSLPIRNGPASAVPRARRRPSPLARSSAGA